MSSKGGGGSWTFCWCERDCYAKHRHFSPDARDVHCALTVTALSVAVNSPLTVVTHEPRTLAATSRPPPRAPRKRTRSAAETNSSPRATPALKYPTRVAAIPRMWITALLWSHRRRGSKVDRSWPVTGWSKWWWRRGCITLGRINSCDGCAVSRMGGLPGLLRRWVTGISRAAASPPRARPAATENPAAAFPNAARRTRSRRRWRGRSPSSSTYRFALKGAATAGRSFRDGRRSWRCC